MHLTLPTAPHYYDRRDDMIHHLSLSASRFQIRWEDNTGRTERPRQPEQFLDLVPTVKSFLQTRNARDKSHRDVAPLLHTGSSANSPKPRKPSSILHLKCSCSLVLLELQLQIFKQSGTTGLQKGLQRQANSHALVFSALTRKHETWLLSYSFETGGRGKNPPVPPRHQHICLLSSPEKERGKIHCACPANDMVSS